jgi:hypothetical protein
VTIVRAATHDEMKSIVEKIQWVYTTNSNGIVIEDKNGGIGAMAVYDRWTPNGVEMHAYSAGPEYIFNPHFVKAMFEYPFIQQNKGLALVCTPCNNVASVAIGRFFGFRETYRIHDGWELGTDMVIQELRRENCRFLEKVSYGKSA